MSAPADRTNEFVRLFSEHSRQIYHAIRAAIPHQADADEVFQETSATLWEKFAEFEPGTNFAAWAVRVAGFKVMEHRNRQRRDRRVFSEELVEAVTAETLRRADQYDERRQLLADCFEQLTPPDQDLLQRRYAIGATTQAVADAVGRNVKTVYRALGRIHQSLFDCVTRKLRSDAPREEDRP